MISLKYSILISYGMWLGGFGIAQAATLLSFDRPNLVVVIDGNRTYGYYTGVSTKPSDYSANEKYECTFMFMRVAGVHEITVRTLDRPIEDWNSAPYSEGSIRIDGPAWQIQFSDRPRGCASKFDQDEIVVPPASPTTNLTEYATRGAHFRVLEKSKVLGIRWVGFDSIVQRRVRGKFISTGEKLATGSPVVLLRKIDAFSEVEYLDLGKGEKIRVWLHSSKLSNPYPKN